MSMSSYSLEELLPIVAKLTEQYTSKESSSVTYERARQFMQAVLYCIHECEGERGLMTEKPLTAKEAYEYGYEKTVEKVKQTQQAYDRLLPDFEAYGNENYHDTVVKGIAGFFRCYDVRFAPQETILTLDYPTLGQRQGLSGIDAVWEYVEDISLEQKFMGTLPKAYVITVLKEFQKDYQKQFYNICNILLRHIISRLLIGKRPGLQGRKEDYDRLGFLVSSSEKNVLQQKIRELLWELIQSEYQQDACLYHYLEKDVEDFAGSLKIGAEIGRLERIVVL